MRNFGRLKNPGSQSSQYPLSKESWVRIYSFPHFMQFFFIVPAILFYHKNITYSGFLSKSDMAWAEFPFSGLLTFTDLSCNI